MTNERIVFYKDNVFFEKYHWSQKAREYIRNNKKIEIFKAEDKYYLKFDDTGNNLKEFDDITRMEQYCKVMYESDVASEIVENIEVLSLDIDYPYLKAKNIVKLYNEIFCDAWDLSHIMDSLNHGRLTINESEDGEQYAYYLDESYCKLIDLRSGKIYDCPKVLGDIYNDCNMCEQKISCRLKCNDYPKSYAAAERGEKEIDKMNEKAQSYYNYCDCDIVLQIYETNGKYLLENKDTGESDRFASFEKIEEYLKNKYEKYTIEVIIDEFGELHQGTDVEMQHKAEKIVEMYNDLYGDNWTQKTLFRDYDNGDFVIDEKYASHWDDDKKCVSNINFQTGEIKRTILSDPKGELIEALMNNEKVRAEYTSKFIKK